MDTYPIAHEIDWNPILLRLQTKASRSMPVYPGDLKTALLKHAGLLDHPKGEAAYQTAVEIARLTTCCDPEVIYWFSRIVSLMNA